MKKFNPWLVLVIICMTTMTIIGGDAIIAPLTATIAAQEGYTISGFMATMSAPMSCIFILVAGILAAYFRKKNLMIVSFAFFVLIGLIAIIGAQFITGPWLFVVIFALCGVAQGMFTTLNVRMISEIFPDEQKRSKAMGFYTASIAIMAIIIVNLSQFFAGGNGSYFDSFKVFYLSIPILIAVCFIPKDKKPEIETREKLFFNIETVKEGWKFWLSFGIVQILYQYCFQFPGWFLAPKGEQFLTNIGILISILFLGVLTGGFIFGIIYNKIKERTSLLVYSFLTLFLIILFFAQNNILLGFGMFGMGVSYSLMYSLSFLRASLRKNPATNIFMIGIMVGIFVFFTPHFYNLIVSITKLNHLQIMPIMFLISTLGVITSFFTNKRITE